MRVIAKIVVWYLLTTLAVTAAYFVLGYVVHASGGVDISKGTAGFIQIAMAVLIAFVMYRVVERFMPRKEKNDA